MERIKTLLKKHPRWNPLSNNNNVEIVNYSNNGISFVARLDSEGFVFDVLIPRNIKIVSIDGQHEIRDIDRTNFFQEIMPNNYMTRLQKLSPFGERKMILLQLPNKRINDVALYNYNWIWNSFLNLNEDDDAIDAKGSRFFTIPGAHDISLINNKIRFVLNVDPNFRESELYSFQLRGGTLDPVDLKTINIRGKEGVTNGTTWVATYDNDMILIHDTAENTITVTMSQSRAVREYILETFRHYVYPQETEIISVSNQIIPSLFCTTVASVLDKVLQIMYDDSKERVQCSLEWGNCVIHKLPMMSFQRHIMISIMKNLQTLESIPISERTQAQWTEIMKLAQTIAYASKHLYIECQMCENQAKLKNENDGTLYCSRKCANKYYFY